MYYIKNKWGDRYYAGWYEGKYTLCEGTEDAYCSNNQIYLEEVLSTMCIITGISISEFEIVWEDTYYEND